MVGFTLWDTAAFAWFGFCWAGYTAFADHSRWRHRSISAAMNRERGVWMTEMLARELRMVDIQIVGNLLRSLGFFASTTILLVAGLIAVLGATEQAVETLAVLPFGIPATKAVWHVKVLLLVTIFVYAFFKFAWAFRLTNNCSILIGAAPAAPADPARAEAHAERAATIIGLAAFHLNRGLRGYFSHSPRSPGSSIRRFSPWSRPGSCWYFFAETFDHAPCALSARPKRPAPSEHRA